MKTLLLSRTHLLCLLLEPNIDRHAEWSVPHVTDMQAATNKDLMIEIWEQDNLEMRRRMMANKDLERKVKNLFREDQKIQ